jgi:Lhr-like helicase
VRIGLSATVKPLDAMARFLIGDRPHEVAIIDAVTSGARLWRSRCHARRSPR